MYVFEWDDSKNQENQKKHGITFEDAKLAFFDVKRIIIKDEEHSLTEERMFCIGKVESRILTVRFTYRNNTIRIFGVGEWRKWRRYYEEENKLR